NSFLTEIRTQRQKEVETISNHIEISLNVIIDKIQIQFIELLQLKESGSKEQGLDGRIKQLEDRLFELNGRLEQRREELQQEDSCAINDIHHYGRAWVLPHPERSSPEIAPMVSNDEIEKIAIQTVIDYEKARGWEVVSVE
ncbi:MAG: helicase, partial [Aphanizomenon sp.]